MFGIVLSALNVIVGFVLRSIVVKFVVYFALYFISTEFIGVLQRIGLFPSASALAGALGGIGSDVWYFLDLFAFSYGVPALLSAYVSRFIIRRIPLIG